MSGNDGRVCSGVVPFGDVLTTHPSSTNISINSSFYPIEHTDQNSSTSTSTSLTNSGIIKNFQVRLNQVQNLQVHYKQLQNNQFRSV